MKWNLEELAEDAVAAYLTAKVSGDMRVYVGEMSKERQFPCAVVVLDTCEPLSEEAEWHDACKITGVIAVLTEDADEIDDAGIVVRTARERNVAARSDIMDAVCISGLNAQLAAQDIDGIAFSMAQVGARRRTVEPDCGYRTDIEIELIAEPVENS